MNETSLIRFDNDYSDGAHPAVLALLAKTNDVRTGVYSEDIFCGQAAEKIRALCENGSCAVHFMTGGTITNMTLITAALRPYQGVISSSVGHINIHETGAIEARGHKVLTIPSFDGKITAGEVKALYEAHASDSSREHTVMPGMVYLTNPTEYGAIYRKSELAAISEVCRRCGLFLYLDGARLGYALTAEGNDLTLADLASLCDAFSIGGTKHGALLGEALVIPNEALQKNFRYYIKQTGGLLAKGRILGIQYLALMEDGLYFKTSAAANRKAARIQTALSDLGYSFLLLTPTNQIFPIFPNRELEILSEKYTFCPMGSIDENTSCVRICTNWATREEDIDSLLADIRALHRN